MTRQYEIKWGKQDGRYTQKRIFDFRENAVLFLNVLILDRGVYDAKLFVVKRKAVDIPREV